MLPKTMQNTRILRVRGAILETVTNFEFLVASPGLILGSCCCLPDEIWAILLPLSGSPHVSGPPPPGNASNVKGFGMASGKGADSPKSTTFGLLWGSLHFSGPRNRKCTKSTGPLEMASGKGADSTKSTTFGLLWGSPHFGGPRNRKSSKSTGAFGNGFRKRSGLYKIDNLEMASGKGVWTLQNRQILGFCGVPSISAVPEAGTPGNPHGRWEWLPEKERALRNRQLLGFCGVPSISAVPEAGNPGHPQGP